MRIAIAEDQENDADHLLADISRWASTNNIPLIPRPVLYTSGEELLADFCEGKFDIIFLDIFLKGINGMETARYIRETDSECSLIFTSFSAEFAIDSYDVNSSWYLLKPYQYEKLVQALTRCGADLLEQKQFIQLPVKNGIQKLLLHQIAWTEYINRQICIHFKNGEELYIRMRQNEFAAMLLPYPYFCDCIKGILVNLEFVDKLQDNCFMLRDGNLIPISRLKYREVRQKFLDHIYAASKEHIMALPS